MCRMRRHWDKFVAIAFAALAAAILGLWLMSDRASVSDMRMPERQVEQAAQTASGPGVVGTLTVGSAQPADIPGAWPGFRGPNHDAIAAQPAQPSWAKGGPRQLWSVPVGEGYAGAAILGGRVYVLDYDVAVQADALRCLSLADGGEIWRYSYPVKVKRNHGMSRTVPAVTDKCVVGIGPMCHVTCLDSTSGQLRWSIDLVRGYGATVPQWYAGQCPLIDGGKAVIAPGGKDALMIAVDCESGQVIWKTPNPRGWKMTHSSIVPMEFAGRRMYVYCASGGVVGVSADDGSILWDTDAWKISNVTVPSPLPAGDGRIFFCGGYGAGSMMMQLEEQAGGLQVKTLFRLPPKTFGSEQHTPVFYQGYIYGVLPRDAGSASAQLACLDSTGRQLWVSGKAARFGLGPYMVAGGAIWAMDESGTLVAAEATPAGYRELARAKVIPDGNESWGPMALAGGRLIVRDLTRMACLDVGASGK